MTDQPVNPLDDLSRYVPPASPLLPKLHSSGRRELRQEKYSKGITIHHRAPTTESAEKAMVKGQAGEVTLPIKRKIPKREGMTKKEWKAYKRSLQS